MGEVKVSGMEALRRGHFCKSPIKAGELLSGTVVCGGCQEPPSVRLFARPRFTIAASSSQNLHGDQNVHAALQGPASQPSMMRRVEPHLELLLTSYQPAPGCCLHILLAYFIGVDHMITDNQVTLCFQTKIRAGNKLERALLHLLFVPRTDYSVSACRQSSSLEKNGFC